ncbi:hypothetical protein [Antrihabitans cavernicola]|uniref:Uncharacterized protein n=1 Tax=Antrihabitans cavernicola TaxID=2495913 RepID=A0A5A7SAC5_9NOCA|nr:hypothetical protein [Spelaeibacter cavernicola]KAA0021161.1 hypothetical protein FOY51_19790 [Spelaeibacter cavernicola]
MTLTVSQVEAWQPDGLQAHSSAYAATVAATDSHIQALGDHQSRITESWHGDAANAATDRVHTEQGLASTVSAAVQQLSQAASEASSTTASAKAHLVTVVNSARAAGFEVADSSQVTAAAKMGALAVVGGLAAEIAMLQLQQECATWTVAVVDALSQCEAAAHVAEGHMQTALAALRDAQASLGDAAPGSPAASSKGGLVDLLTGKTSAASADAPAGSLQDILARMQQHQDLARTQASAATFTHVTGRAPTTPADWATANALNPNSYDPKYGGVGAQVRVVKINPVHGQGVVRAAQYIEQRDVSNPDFQHMNPGARELGDNRTADPHFDPEHARVTTYVDYENGVVVMRQNPSVQQDSDGFPGKVEVGSPEGRVWQNSDGSVRIQYSAGNPFAPDAAMRPPFGKDHAMTVNGDLVFQPGPNGVQVNGTRTDYPSMEVYQDQAAGGTRTVVVDPAASGRSLGPATNLEFHHDIGVGGAAFRPFSEWDNQYDVPGNPTPSTPFGPVTNPPSVPVPPIAAGTT